jgi:hypothetical protein
MFGQRVGRCCATAFEIAAGETDLVANRIEGGSPNPNEIFAARKRRLITSRMIASQAVSKSLNSYCTHSDCITNGLSDASPTLIFTCTNCDSLKLNAMIVGPCRLRQSLS